MNALLARAGRRFYLRHPWQLCLALTGIALGVAVYVGVDLANDSARRAFELSAELVTGRTTHHLMGTDGTVPDDTYRELRVRHGPLLAAPVIEDEVRLAHNPSRELTVIGIDPLEETAFRGFSGLVPGRAADLTRLMVEPGSVLVPPALAAELDLQTGSNLDLLVGETPATVRIVGTVGAASPTTEGATAPIVTDIATAQELFARRSLSRIDLILTEAEARRLEALALEGVTLVPAGGRNAAFDALARAFRINLTALSLLALLVGVFLIYATMSFAVVQRRETFGVLRAIGVTRGQLLAGVLTEALAVGTAATALGLLVGQQLAGGLVELVLRTVGDFYGANVSAAAPSAWLYGKGLALGLGTTLLAAAAPALDAAGTAPHAAMSRAALERSARRVTDTAAWIAVPVAVAAVILLTLPLQGLFVAFAGLFCVIAAGALTVPTATRLLAKALEPLLASGFGITGTLAARGVSASLSRTGVASAALAVAVATVVGIGLMIGSFRTSVEAWLAGTLTADLYLSADAGGVFDDARLAALDAVPGVAGMSVTRFARIPTAAGELSLRAQRPGPLGWGLSLTEQAPRAVQRMAAGEGVLVSEPLAFRRDLDPGDTLSLPTATGDRQFDVLGAFRDYNTDGGTVLMPLAVYRMYWRDDAVNGVGVYLSADADRAGTVAGIRGVFGGAGTVRIQSNDLIRERSLAVFDQTFRITEVLRILAGLVAFLGLASALMSIELERAREVAILRSLGLRPRQTGVLTLAQTSLLGLATGLLAMPLGLVMAALLIFVINVRSFGWSMELVVSARPLWLGVTLALGAALLAGIYPAVRAVNSGIAARLREE